jgi:hypothetical protein
MELSACGLGCKKCELVDDEQVMCDEKNPVANQCPIFQCVKEHGLSSCIECPNHLNCELFRMNIEKCPLRPTMHTCVMCGVNARLRLNKTLHAFLKSTTGGEVF